MLPYTRDVTRYIRFMYRVPLPSITDSIVNHLPQYNVPLSLKYLQCWVFMAFVDYFSILKVRYKYTFVGSCLCDVRH